MSNESNSHEVHPHEVHLDDLTLYALGALEATELARVGKHVEDCAACRQEVQRLRADMGAYAMASVDEAVPPDSAKRRLMSEIVRTTPKPQASSWRWSFAFRAAVALILLVAVLLEWNQVQSLRKANKDLQHQLAQLQSDSAQARAIAETIKAPDAMKLTLVAANAKLQPMAHVFCSTQQGRVFLIANDLAPLGKGKMYELWLLPKSGAPVPAGMFQSDPDWNAHMMHSGLPRGMEAKGFAITIEPEEGSLAPTSTPILVGLQG